MGLSRNKVAVPEGVAGTPPFWSLLDTLLAVRATRQVLTKVLLYSVSLLFYTVEIIDNTERDNEVKKLKRDYSLYKSNKFEFFRVAK